MKRVAPVLATLFVSLLTVVPACAKGKDKVEPIKFTFNGKQRSYLVQIPTAPDPTKPLPVVMLLHAQGGWDTDVMGLWHSFASHEGFIVVAPESMANTLWDSRVDGPDYLHAILLDVAKKHPIDPTRVYLFGDESGGIYGIEVGLFDSQDWAATCARASIIDTSNYSLFPHAVYKEPFEVWVGDNDADHPLRVLALEHDAFTKAGFTFDLKIIPNSSGSYGNVYDEVNDGCYKFFTEHPMPAPGAGYLAAAAAAAPASATTPPAAK
jgi:poly(3-hydroxybutyrate) depolymerase